MRDWKRLAKQVVEARTALGYRTREDFGRVTGVSSRTLGDIELARRTSYNPRTLTLIEDGLQWAPGSIDAVLDGRSPTTTEGSPQIPSPTLPPRVAHELTEGEVLDYEVMDLGDDGDTRIITIVVRRPGETSPNPEAERRAVLNRFARIQRELRKIIFPRSSDQ